MWAHCRERKEMERSPRCPCTQPGTLSPLIVNVMMWSPLPTSSPAHLSEGCERPQHQKTFSMLNPVRVEDSSVAQNKLRWSWSAPHGAFHPTAMPWVLADHILLHTLSRKLSVKTDLAASTTKAHSAPQHLFPTRHPVDTTQALASTHIEGDFQ